MRDYSVKQETNIDEEITSMTTQQIDLNSYDFLLICSSGGKDSTAAMLWLDLTYFSISVTLAAWQITGYNRGAAKRHFFSRNLTRHIIVLPPSVPFADAGPDTYQPTTAHSWRTFDEPSLKQLIVASAALI